MNVSEMIVGAFDQAARMHPELNKAWIRISVRLGSALPKSRLMSNVQSDGRLDLVLRCMEDERVAGAQAAEQDGMFDSHYQRMLSEAWTGNVYQTLRIVERFGTIANDDVRSLTEDFRLLRVPLEKHQIAWERDELTAPLQLQRVPAKGDHTDTYLYEKTDPKRTHIMPTRLSYRGSVEWQVIDLKGGHDRWIERRALSDRIIALWG